MASDWEELYRTLYEQAPIGVLIYERDMRVREVNARLLSILKTKRDEVVGFDLTALRDRRVLPALTLALAGEVGHYEGPYDATTSPASVFVSLRAAPVRDAARRVVGAMALVEDITERRLAEDALRRSEARFREVIERSPDATAVVVHGRFAYANPALLALLRCEVADVLGRPVTDYLHIDDRATAATRITEREAGAPPTLQEYRALRRDGTTFHAEVVSMRIEYDGKPALVAIARDVTERRLLHARLSQADRVLTMGTLAAGIAHEIRNPLAYLSANLDFLADTKLPRLAEALARQEARLELYGEPPTDVRPSLDAVTTLVASAREGASRVRTIVRDLRTFSRDDDRRVPVDVRAVLDACVAVAESDLLPRARVVRDYADVPLVSASESRLGQVFLNLIVNAAQSIAPGAADANAITLRVATGADGAVEVRVDDTGSGIAAEHLPRLFEPFFTTKPADVGTGLGLWICADIVQRLGGTIAAQSDGVRGASFVVSLPADATVARPEPVSPPPPRAIPGGRRPRVLVVDDEEALARIVASVLSDEFDVVVEGGGRAALTLLDRDAAFDAVLCDLAMPDLSGADVFTTLEERAPRLAERVVFATGGAYSAASRAILDRAPNPTVDKPFELESLRAVLRKVASRAEADRSR